MEADIEFSQLCLMAYPSISWLLTNPAFPKIASAEKKHGIIQKVRIFFKKIPEGICFISLMHCQRTNCRRDLKKEKNMKYDLNNFLGICPEKAVTIK